MPSPSQLPAVLPSPFEMELRSGEFAFTPGTVIVADEPNQQNARYLRDLLAPPTGFPLPIQVGHPTLPNAIRLTTGEPPLGCDGYTLDVTRDSVIVEACEPVGVFYGLQTLRQLLPPQIERRALVKGVAWRAPCVAVQDTPRFAWRGYMLDEGRHFHGKETVKRALDLMALHKLNVFHWHLTEDQGWRIEIKQYPRLTEIGSRRAGTTQGLLGQHNGVPHGGFYTQDDLREIVAYAVERHITVVPEIEMPGHSLAALAAYPELSCTGRPFEVACGFGVMQDIHCGGKEKVFEFLQNVLDEVMALFPSPYIHIGGDEAPKSRWKKCPDCQRRIRQEKLKDEHVLQTYLTNRIAAYLESYGRRLVGWNQVLQPGLTPSAVAQYWIGNRKSVVEALRSGRDVIMSPFMLTYLDHSYSLTSLRKAYEYEPVWPGLDAPTARHVLGIEAPLWTEWVPTRARLDYQTYPRLAAYAETAWTPRECKDYANFRERLAVFLARLDELGVRYAPLRDAEPPFWMQWLGTLTILQPQTRTA